MSKLWARGCCSPGSEDTGPRSETRASSMVATGTEPSSSEAAALWLAQAPGTRTIRHLSFLPSTFPVSSRSAAACLGQGLPGSRACSEEAGAAAACISLCSPVWAVRRFQYAGSHNHQGLEQSFLTPALSGHARSSNWSARPSHCAVAAAPGQGFRRALTLVLSRASAGAQSPQFGPQTACYSTETEAESSSSSGPVSSPLLSPIARPSKGQGAGAGDGRKVKAKLSGIKQGVLKVNLVATLVRGMSVEDALNQLAVMPKRAAKTVSKVVHAAKSNAVQNHGLDGAKLVVDEAFVGKDIFLKRMNPHGRGKSGVKVRQRSQLTVLVREMTEDEIGRREEARRPTSTWRKKLSLLQKRRLVPHRLLEVAEPPGQENSAAAVGAA